MGIIQSAIKRRLWQTRLVPCSGRTSIGSPRGRALTHHGWGPARGWVASGTAEALLHRDFGLAPDSPVQPQPHRWRRSRAAWAPSQNHGGDGALLYRSLQSWASAARPPHRGAGPSRGPEKRLIRDTDPAPLLRGSASPPRRGRSYAGAGVTVRHLPRGVVLGLLLGGSFPGRGRGEAAEGESGGACRLGAWVSSSRPLTSPRVQGDSPLTHHIPGAGLASAGCPPPSREELSTCQQAGPRPPAAGKPSCREPGGTQRPSCSATWTHSSWPGGVGPPGKALDLGHSLRGLLVHLPGTHFARSLGALVFPKAARWASFAPEPRVLW